MFSFCRCSYLFTMSEYFEELADDPRDIDLLQSPSRGRQQSTLTSFFLQRQCSSSSESDEPPVTAATTIGTDQGESSDGSSDSRSHLSEDDRTKLSVPHSMIWHYFDKISKETAKCKNCGKVKNTPTGTTTVLIRHLAEHPALYSQYLRLQQEKTRVANLRSAKKSPKRLQERSAVLFPLDPRGQKSKTITNAIALFLCKGLKPYSVVEEPGFKHLVSVLEPRYKVPSRAAFTRTIIPDMYKKLKKKLEERLDKVRDCLESVSFTTDV